jgi:hypothetical protein
MAIAAARNAAASPRTLRTPMGIMAVMLASFAAPAAIPSIQAEPSIQGLVSGRIGQQGDSEDGQVATFPLGRVTRDVRGTSHDRSL